ncbi:MAG: thiamine-phosphate kinase [Woeseiaceae bacterium]|nr:thiamine-phosphate kinase [Woeseiaceae bacterium]
MDEFGLIQKFFVGDWPQSESLVAGIGDDGAVLKPSPGSETVAAVDAMVEGVHFLSSIDPGDLGYRLVAVNLSDMAAMGATPRWMTLSLAIPEADPGWLRRFSQGMRECAESDGVALIGGDTTRARVTVVSLQMLGEVPEGQALLRSGAQPGDAIYTTGHPGDAAAGLDARMQGDPGGELYDAFARPVSRVAYGRQLRGVAHAAIDTSDGLFADLGKLVASSGVGATLAIDQLPLSEGLMQRCGREEAVDFALSGGDDYELLFVTDEHPPDYDDVTVTRIGEIVPGSGIACTENGEPFNYEDSGYLHFQ